jgi:hypothetical protein
MKSTSAALAVLRAACAAFAACAAAAQAQPAPTAPTARPADPLDAGVTVPAAIHRPAFAGYRRFAEQEVGPWRAANDTVGAIGGWRAYALEVQAGAADAAPAAVPPAAAPGTAAPAPPGTARDGGPTPDRRPGGHAH